MYIPPKVKPLCPPEKKPRFEDVPYAEVTLDNGKPYTLKMDIYQTEDQTEPGPCILYIFGGGWSWGEYKQVTQKAVYCRDLVRLTDEGYTIVCPDYRLISQSIFPACVHDVKGCVRFLRANAEKFHIDPDRIGALGNSAGGHLSAMLSIGGNQPAIEGSVGGNLEYSSAVKAAALYYPPSDLLDCVLSAAVESMKTQLGILLPLNGCRLAPDEASIIGYAPDGWRTGENWYTRESGFREGERFRTAVYYGPDGKPFVCCTVMKDMPHGAIKEQSRAAWRFLRQFRRNPETKEIERMEDSEC